MNATTVRAHASCNRKYHDDLTRWCAGCAAEYLTDRAAGSDWMAGRDAHGNIVPAFAGHVESLEVIADFLAAQEGLDGGGYDELGPVEEDMAELTAMASGVA